MLAGADVIACEDTRVTRKLLDHYGITTPLTPYHEHNAAEARPKLLARLAEGASRRARLRRRHAADFRSRLPAGARGDCEAASPSPLCRARRAVLAALSLAGLPTDRFFLRRLPAAEGWPRGRSASPALAAIPATLILFESGPRIANSLAELPRDLGRVRRGLPRTDQAARRGAARRHCAALAEHYANGAETRGEFVLVIAPPPEQDDCSRKMWTPAASGADARLDEGCGERSRRWPRAGRAAKSINARSTLTKGEHD